MATTALDSARPMTFIKPVFTPWARLITGLQPVARRAQPSSVLKNRTSRVTSTAAQPSSTGSAAGMFIWVSSTSMLRAGRAWFALPRIFRFTDQSTIWVRIPARMGGMPSSTWSRPVTVPASRPASTAHSMAIHGLWPASSSMVHTAAPVQREPSTVRSAISRTL